MTGNALDILVNNSGVALAAPVLDTDLDMARSLPNVDVLGLLAVIKVCMPLLVNSRHVIVVNNSSTNGETNFPFSGVDGSSKAASTSMSEKLRLELAPLNIRVVTDVTGIVESNLHSNEPEQDFSQSTHYAGVSEWLDDRKTGKNRPKGMPVDDYARVLVGRVERGQSGKLYIGPLTPMFVCLKWWMLSIYWVSVVVASPRYSEKETYANQLRTSS